MDYAKFCAREIFDYQPIILSKCDFFFNKYNKILIYDVCSIIIEN